MLFSHASRFVPDPFADSDQATRHARLLRCQLARVFQGNTGINRTARHRQHLLALLAAAGLHQRRPCHDELMEQPLMGTGIDMLPRR
jgi:hypothetical protein